MNGAYLHLAVNHIPVVGLPVCFLLLAAAVLRKSRDLMLAGYIATVLVAIMTIVAYKSGGPAAHIVRGIQDISRETIHAHAEEATEVFRLTMALGWAAIFCLWRLGRMKDVPNWLTALMLAGTLAASLWMGYVSHLGGLIRHPEIEMIMGEKMP